MVFKKFQGFYKKNDFELMISIYLFTKKKELIFSISKKKIIYIYCIKIIYYKISICAQKLFYLLLQKMNEFLQFYLQKNFNLFSFKKSDLYKLFKKTKLHLQKEF